MSRYNNGGTVSPVTAARTTKNTRSHYTAANQIQSLKRLHSVRPILTHGEACEQLQALGFEHTDKVPVSGSDRIPARGKGPSNTGAAVRWTDDMRAMHWREFTTDDHGTLFSDDTRPINRAEAAALFRQAEQRRREQEAERIETQQRVARQAQDMYRAGVNNGKHEYITRKGLTGLYNARLDADTGTLLIPMWVSGIGLVNLQRILTSGKKLFLAGGRVAGAYSVIGSLDGAERVLICEGWATGAALFELHGLPVVVAFNAGNLMAVSQTLRSRFENLSIVVAGDNDRLNTINIGRVKAIEAAEAIGATLLFPELCRCCKCTDHCDTMQCSRRRSNG